MIRFLIAEGILRVYRKNYLHRSNIYKRVEAKRFTDTHKEALGFAKDHLLLLSRRPTNY